MKRAFLHAVVALVIASSLAACGLSPAPAVPAANDWTSAPGGQPGAGPSPTPAVPVEEVSASRQALTATLGIQVFWGPESSASIASDANRIFNYVVSLGANSVGINFFFYTDGVTPTKVYAGAQTPTPAMIGQITAIARAHGLRVLIRPLLNENNLIDPQGDWRGSIRPPSTVQWFTSYFNFLRPYFVAAQQSNATSFDVGSELDSLAPDQAQWTWLEAKARQLFTGQLDYAVNYGRWQLVPSYEPVPVAAVDAYPVLPVGNFAPVGRLTNAWVNWLLTQPESVLHQTVLQEVGIAAVVGAYAEPARSYPVGTPIDINVQVKWFEAACNAAKQVGLAGIYFYDVNGIDQPQSPAAAGYAPGSFIDRGASEIATCFASGWS